MRKTITVVVTICLISLLTMIVYSQGHSKTRRRQQSRPTTPRPTPTPLPEPTVKEIGENMWKVTLPADGNWFDTGIPVICNMEVDIRNLGADRNDKFLTKIGGKVFYNINAGFDNMRTMFLLYIAEAEQHGPANLMVDYDFQDTIKLKVDDEGNNQSLFLTVRLEERRDFDPMHFNDSHMALHIPSKRWFEDMKRKLARQ